MSLREHGSKSGPLKFGRGFNKPMITSNRKVFIRTPATDPNMSLNPITQIKKSDPLLSQEWILHEIGESKQVLKERLLMAWSIEDEIENETMPLEIEAEWFSNMIDLSSALEDLEEAEDRILTA